MKKLIAILTLCLSTTAFADGYHHHGGGHYHHSNGGDWIAPAIIGGVIGYGIGRNSYPTPNVYSYPYPAPYPVYPNPPVVYQEPVYQYTWIYDDWCRCNKRVLVRVY